MSNDNAIRADVAALERAWNAHDADAWAAMFVHDASFTNVFGIEMIGRDAIANTHRHIMTTMFRASRAQMDVTSIRFVRPDVASVSIRWRMWGAYDIHGNPWPDRHGLMALVMTSEADGWRIAVLHNMDVPEPDQVAGFRSELNRQMQ